MSEQKGKHPKDMSPEEIEKRKAEITKFHKEQIPFLETQFKYENLLTQIQQAHTDRLEAEYKWIQLKAAMEGMLKSESGEPSQTPTPTPNMTAHRTLKKEPQDADK